MENALLVCQSKLVILSPVRVCSGFASSGVYANANLIVISPKEQTGVESIVYSAGTITRSIYFTKPGFKNQAVSEQTITNFIPIAQTLPRCCLQCAALLLIYFLSNNSSPHYVSNTM